MIKFNFEESNTHLDDYLSIAFKDVNQAKKEYKEAGVDTPESIIIAADEWIEFRETLVGCYAKKYFEKMLDQDKDIEKSLQKLKATYDALPEGSQEYFYGVMDRHSNLNKGLIFVSELENLIHELHEEKGYKWDAEIGEYQNEEGFILEIDFLSFMTKGYERTVENITNRIQSATDFLLQRIPSYDFDEPEMEWER